jgi:hypothetical protein
MQALVRVVLVPAAEQELSIATLIPLVAKDGKAAAKGRFERFGVTGLHLAGGTAI